MKGYLFTLLIFIFLKADLIGQVTPHTVNMAAGDSNSTAFGVDGQLGTNGATFYLHWDATYLYFGWDGGNTYWTDSDMYFVGIDTQNDSGASTTSELGGVTFSDAVFDYYVVSENNCSHYGPNFTCNGSTGTEGNALELWKANSSGGWTHQVRRSGNDNIESRRFDNIPGETRLRIAWADLLFTPGPNNPIAFTFWTNNASLNYVWGAWPAANPATGPTPYTLTSKLFFSSTGNGVNTSSEGTVLPLATALSIKLINFNASESQKVVTLDWTTASERSSSHFEIEHSIDGSLFESIGRVESAGESSVNQNYEFEHEDPALGDNYYRLAHYDLDGTLSYSDIESVYFGKGKSISIFPNPVKGGFTISTTEDYNIESYSVFDMQGGLVEQKSVIQYRNNIEVETNEWCNGVYQVLVVYSNGTTAVKNVVKQ